MLAGVIAVLVFLLSLAPESWAQMPTSGYWCVNDANGNGTLDEGEMAQCVDAGSGKYLCPLNLTQCNAQLICPFGADIPCNGGVCSATGSCAQVPDDTIYTSGFIQTQSGKIRITDIFGSTYGEWVDLNGTGVSKVITGKVYITSTYRAIEVSNGSIRYCEYGLFVNCGSWVNLNGSGVSRVGVFDQIEVSNRQIRSNSNPFIPLWPGPVYQCSLDGKKHSTLSACVSACTQTTQCTSQYVCPYGSQYSCVLYNGQQMCSNVNCFDASTTPTETVGTPEGANDKKNDGQVTEQGCIGKIYIFNGQDRRCRPPGTQTFFNDCCTKDKISLFNLVTIGKCNTDEQQLAKMRTTYLDEDYSAADANCHYVGEYCHEEWELPGGIKICVQKKKTFCCFSSPLARIIHEQGRPQLGISWGEPDSPQCRGFTIDEFQKLDLSKMDFSEWIEHYVGPHVTSGVQQNVQNTVNQIKNMLPQ